MASMPSPTCGAITGPIADTTTYTYSNLNTGFIPPESCLQPTYTPFPDGYDSGFTGISTITVGANISTSTAWAKVYRGREPACFPSKYPRACEYQGTIQQQKNYIYSPGTCPSGYAPATVFIDESSSSMTTATCCPSGFSLSTVRLNVGQTFWGDFVSCTSKGDYVVFEDATKTFSPHTLTFIAPTLVVAWQETDVSRWSNAPSTSSPTSSSFTSTSVPETGLSTGIQVGVGVGSAAVAMIIAAIIFLLTRRHRIKKRQLNGEDTLIPQRNEVSSTKENKSHAELADGATLQELAGQERWLEADNLNVRAELM